MKVELAVARGKEQRDKRRDVVERDAKRQMERALKQPPLVAATMRATKHTGAPWLRRGRFSG